MSKEMFRKFKFLIAVVVFIVAAGTGMKANAQTTVNGAITCDNHWALYYGTSTGATYSGLTGQYPISSPITLTIPSGNPYIYVLAWGDNAVAQGFLATLQNIYGSPLQTGSAPWMVAPNALTQNLNGAQSSTVLTGLAPLLLSNNPSWTSPIIGPLNTASSSSPWPQISGISASSRWIWYKNLSGSPPCVSATGSPFVPGCNHGEPLLFRLPVEVLKPCLTVISDRTPCCIGRDSKGNPIYAFSATVKNPTSSTVPLTIGGPAGTTILSYAPLSIPPGNSVVSGTFTVTGSVQTPFCLVFEITLPGYVDDSGNPVETGRQSDGSAVQDAGDRKPFPVHKVKCRGSLCFKQLPPC